MMKTSSKSESSGADNFVSHTIGDKLGSTSIGDKLSSTSIGDNFERSLFPSGFSRLPSIFSTNFDTDFTMFKDDQVGCDTDCHRPYSCNGWDVVSEQDL